MQYIQDRGDMIKTAHFANQSSGSILHSLEFVQLVCRKALQEAIAIVQSADD